MFANIFANADFTSIIWMKQLVQTPISAVNFSIIWFSYAPDTSLLFANVTYNCSH